MIRKNRPLDPARKSALLASLKRDNDAKAKTYREQALKMFPHICQRCGREFSGVRLRELTVHHKDGNHMNNPPDGSNWALLCLYCHDDEHGTYEQRGLYAEGAQMNSRDDPLGFRAFEALRDKLSPEDEAPKSEEPDGCDT